MSQTHQKSDHESPPGTPRWVKLFVIIAIVLVVLVVILHLTGYSFGVSVYRINCYAGAALARGIAMLSTAICRTRNNAAA